MSTSTDLRIAAVRQHADDTMKRALAEMREVAYKTDPQNRLQFIKELRDLADFISLTVPNKPSEKELAQGMIDATDESDRQAALGDCGPPALVPDRAWKEDWDPNQ